MGYCSLGAACAVIVVFEKLWHTLYVDKQLWPVAELCQQVRPVPGQSAVQLAALCTLPGRGNGDLSEVVLVDDFHSVSPTERGCFPK